MFCLKKWSFKTKQIPQEVFLNFIIFVLKIWLWGECYYLLMVVVLQSENRVGVKALFLFKIVLLTLFGAQRWTA